MICLLLACCGGCHYPSVGFWDRRGTIDAVAFLPQADLVAVGGRDVGTDSFSDHGDIKLYRVTDGVLEHQVELPHRISMLASAPKGGLLAAVSSVSRTEGHYRDSLVVFRIADNGPSPPVFEIPDMPGTGIMEFSRDSRHLLVVDAEGVTVWSTRTWTTEIQRAGKYRCAALSADGGCIAVIPWRPGAPIEVWNVREHRKVAELIGSHPLSLDPSGRWWVFPAGARRALVFWNVERQMEEFAVELPGSTCRAFAIAPDGTLAAIIVEERESLFGRTKRAHVYVWTGPAYSDGGKAIRTPWPRNAYSLAFVDGSGMLAVGSGAGVRLYDVGTGQLVQALPARGSLDCGAGQRRLVTSTGESIAVWDVGRASVKLAWQDRWRRHPWSPLE